MGNADAKTLLIAFIFMPFVPLWVNGCAKSKVHAFTRKMFRQIQTGYSQRTPEPAKVAECFVPNGRWLSGDYNVVWAHISELGDRIDCSQQRSSPAP
jgi:hypothetical protein